MKLKQVDRRIRFASPGIEALETRSLLSATLVANIPDQSISSGTLPASLSLGAYFNDPQVTGTAIVLQTQEGAIPIVLTDSATPKTVANFLHYVNSGEYANTVFHRAVSGYILQGGGYLTNGSHIQQFATVPDESATETLKNTTATIAMALPQTGPGNATSEWFINLNNNPQLDETNRSASDYTGGPFTAFGMVIYNGMSVVNSISHLALVNANVESGAWTTLPVLPNYTGPSTATAAVPAADLVTINPQIIPGGLTYTVISSNPDLVSGVIANNNLTVTPGTGSGSATLTVTATDMGGGTATSTFAVHVVNTTPNVTIGAGGAKSVAYTDSNGAHAVITLKGAGSAIVTFSGSNFVQMTTRTGVTMTGSGLGISSIAINGTGGGSSLLITSSGGINVGLINTDAVKMISGKGVTLTGPLTSSSAIGGIMLAGANGGTISAASIGSLTTTGVFSDDVTLSGPGIDLAKFSAGSITGGTWTVSGSAGVISAGTASNWAPTFAGGVKSLKFGGNVSANVKAASIGTFVVKGSLNSSQLYLSGAGNDLNSLIVGGNFSQAVINSVGSIGTITALSLTNAEIYAGVGVLSNNLVLPSVPGDFSSMASIKSIKLKGAAGGDTFSNSDIAAAHIGLLSLGTLQTAGNTNIPGIVAETIASLTAVTNKKFKLKSLNNASDIATLVANMDVMLGQIVIQAL
jgi:cyclophilin family peptidyl-prolyl cis-trans isomerase